MKIVSKNQYPEELEITHIVENLFRKYNIPVFTEDIIVEKGVVPHSHPVLTLNTRSSDERSVLFVLVHEQFHWYAEGAENYNNAIDFLKLKYLDDGEHNKNGLNDNSYWEHIIVCFNTRNYLKRFLNEADFDWVYKQWLAYPSLEKMIAERYVEIEQELKGLNMVFENK